MPSFDENLTQALRDAAELAPDLPGPALVEPAERRGRRLRARRRAALAGGTALLVAAGVTTVVALRPGGAATAVSAAESPTVSAPQSGRPQTPETRFMLTTLRSLLPPGRISSAHGTEDGSGSWGLGPSVMLDYDNGHGAATLRIDTNRMPTPLAWWTDHTQCPDPFTMPVTDCTRTTRPDGSVLVVARAAEHRASQVDTMAYLTGADGRQLMLTEEPTRQDAPLTGDQLATVLEHADWSPAFAHVPVWEPPYAPAFEPTPDQVLAKAGKLLPTGATSTIDSSQQNGLTGAHFAVTLGGRTSMVMISVINGFGKGVPAETQRAFDATAGAHLSLTHTANGTSVLTDKDGTGSTVTTHGAEVTALTPAGNQVTVSEWNGPNGYTFTGGALALDTDQLAAIALGTDWSKP